MGKLCEIRGPAGTILQSELEQFIYIKNQIRRLKRKRDEMAANMIERLLGGAEVEKGAHVAEISERSSGSSIEKRLVVK